MDIRFNEGLRAAVYLLASIILWFCIRPIMALTLLRSGGLFALFIGATMVLLFLHIPRIFVVLEGALMIPYCLHYYYYPRIALTSPEWVTRAVADVTANIRNVWQGDLIHLSNVFVTLLLFCLLWFIILVLHYELKNERFIFFFSLAILSQCIVGLATRYQATSSIFVILACSFLLLALLNFIKEKDYHQAAAWSSFVRWVAGVSVLIVLLLILAAGLPKPNAHGDNLLPNFFQNMISIGGDGASGFGAQRIGYDPDDTHLGGSLNMDSTVLFTAEITGSGNYWRVASKDTYTGKGWTGEEQTEYLPVNGRVNSSLLNSLYENKTKVSTQHAWLRFSRESPAVLPYMGQIEQVQVPGHQEMINRQTLQVMTNDQRSVRSASLTYLEPSFQLQDLRKVRSNADPAQIRRSDLQLPRALPNRIRALAQRLTTKANNRYAKAMAIEDYLHSSRFTYSTDNIPHPGNNQDYVDQFLFETKTGYCDNFSSAMVVLLRASGIPARWVKGFTTGSYMGEDDQRRLSGQKTLTYTYQVTNENAHSWVEAYFPGSGWVTFEPTPSFSDPSQFVSTARNAGNSSTAKKSASSPESRQANKKASQSSSSKPKKTRARAAHQQSAAPKKKKQIVWHGMAHWRQAAVILCALAAIAVILLLITKKKWYSAWLSKKLKEKMRDDHAVFLQAYKRLNKILAMKGFQRSASETARSFAQRVDHAFAGSEMTELTIYYERLVYGGESLSTEDFTKISSLFDAITDHAVSFKNHR